MELADAAASINWMYRWMPEWLLALTILTLAIALAVVAHRPLIQAARRITDNKEMFWRSLVSRLTRPIQWTLILGSVAVGAVVVPLNGYV